MRAERAIAAVVLAASLAGCAVSGPPPTAKGEPAVVRYVAIGDSYTIGTSVSAADRFPDQLVAALESSGGAADAAALELVANLGVNGYTSTDLIRDELPEATRLAPDLVTVLIGVNDVVQGVPAATYEANVVTILDGLLEHLPGGRIVTVAIPDYTVTPTGSDYGDPSQQHEGIVANNAIMARLAGERGIPFVDTFDISLQAADDRALVADDGLHPSGAQYALWVERIAPVVEAALGG